MTIQNSTPESLEQVILGLYHNAPSAQSLAKAADDLLAMLDTMGLNLKQPAVATLFQKDAFKPKDLDSSLKVMEI